MDRQLLNGYHLSGLRSLSSGERPNGSSGSDSGY